MRLKKINISKVISRLLLLTILPIVHGFSQPLSDEEVIRKAYNNWVKATNAKDIDQWASFLAPDAIFHPPNHQALLGNKDIIDYYLNLFSDRRFALKCIQDTIVISESLDFAWSTGRCEATFTGQDGKEDKDKSKWIKIWIRLPNGDWKCKTNSWSSIFSN